MTEDGAELGYLRPGEAIADGHRVTTKKGSLLILSRNGFQLTAGEKTSFRLPGTEAVPEILLDQGWLRVRLATSVDREARIKTAEFDISASQATLTLKAAPTGTSLVVDAGSIVLATTDGRHRANLVTGAAAKIDLTAGDDLLIQHASRTGFKKYSPFPASSGHRDDDRSPLASASVEKRSQTASSPPKPRLSTTTPAPGGNLTILPASRLKRPDGNRLEPQDPIAAASPAFRSSAMQSDIRLSQEPYEHASIDSDSVPSSMPEGDDGLPIAGRQRLETPGYRPVQLQFDRLTEGLLEGL